MTARACIDCAAALSAKSSSVARCRPCSVKARMAVVPDGFAEVAAHLSQRELAARFKLQKSTVRRILTRLGIESRGTRVETAEQCRDRMAKVHAAIRGKPRAGRETAASKRSSVNPYGSVALRTVERHQHRDASTAGQAAEHLQRTAPVYRCDEVGRADPKGSHWRYGSIVLTPDELIARAERKGFNPNAWRAIPTPARASSAPLLPVGQAGNLGGGAHPRVPAASSSVPA